VQLTDENESEMWRSDADKTNSMHTAVYDLGQNDRNKVIDRKLRPFCTPC